MVGGINSSGANTMVTSPIQNPKNSSAARKPNKQQKMAFRGRSSGIVAQQNTSGMMQTEIELQQMLQSQGEQFNYQFTTQ
jgi:hypothetical protein